MKNFFKKLDMYLDRKWKETAEILFYLSKQKIEKKDKDWHEMQNNINKDKKNEN